MLSSVTAKPDVGFGNIAAFLIPASIFVGFLVIGRVFLSEILTMITLIVCLVSRREHSMGARVHGPS